jgi:hypothetical protein
VTKKLGEAELKLKIADLTGVLADIEITLADAKAEIAEKDETIRHLQSLQKRRDDDLIEYRGYFYRKVNDKPVGNAFCPVCAQKDGVLVETTWSMGPGRGTLCPACKAIYHNVTGFGE